MRETQTRTKKKSEESDNQETLKAAAWAVFQHRNGGGSSTNRHHGPVPVPQATRFKIEAQIKRELERRSVFKDNLPSWNVGSALFDAYELGTVFKHLDLAFQSVDTQQRVPLDRSEHTEESISEPALIYSSRQSQYTDRHAKYPQHYSRQGYPTAAEDISEQRNWLDTVDESHRIRANYLDTVDETPAHGYAAAEEYTLDQRNWLDTVDESQRVRANYLETVDETLPFMQEETGYGYDENKVYRHEDRNLKLVTSMHIYEPDTPKDVQEAEPRDKFFKPMQFSHTPSRWNVLQGRRCSFDTSPQPNDIKDIKQSRKWKLQNIFKSKAAKDGTTPKPSRQAQIVPDDLSQKGRKGKTQNPLRRSGELEHKKFSTGPQDSDISDSAKGDGYDASQEYASVTMRAHQDQIPLPHGGKSGLHKVLVPTFSRTVRLSSDMSNPNTEEGLLNHLKHGALTCGAPAPPSVRRKGSYSLNVSPVQQPRKSMLQGARDDFDLDSEMQYHHEYHHHYHHHHHHIGHGQDDDYELTVQDIVRRVPRKSSEEMAHRLSFEENTGLKAPRNSLEASCYNPATSKLFL